MDTAHSIINLELELPSELARFSLPEGVDRRLQFLLDKQDQSGVPLTGDELAEAEGLVEVVDFLSLLKLCARCECGPHPCRLQRQVLERAGQICEYCRLPQADQEATFHIDHIIPRSAAGETSSANLALACVSCSLRKGPRMKARDPKTGQEVPLFHPRDHDWSANFRITGDGWVEGLTPIGWATIDLLKMNRPVAVRRRREEALLKT